MSREIGSEGDLLSYTRFVGLWEEWRTYYDRHVFCEHAKNKFDKSSTSIEWVQVCEAIGD